MKIDEGVKMYRKYAVKDSVLEYINNHEDEVFLGSQIIDAMGVGMGSAYRAFKLLVNEGKIDCIGEGKGKLYGTKKAIQLLRKKLK